MYVHNAFPADKLQISSKISETVPISNNFPWCQFFSHLYFNERGSLLILLLLLFDDLSKTRLNLR